MKKILLSVSTLLLIAVTAQAQTRFGLKGGANFANLKVSEGDVDESFDNKIGAYGGIFLNSPFGPGLAVQPELVFSMEGAKMDDEKLNLTYVNLPVMFQLHAAGFVAETGPQVGFLLSAEAAGEDVKDEVKKIALAWGLGAGYRLPGGLGLNARYNIGLSNIAKESDETKVRSNVLQVGLTLLLGGRGTSSKE